MKHTSIASLSMKSFELKRLTEVIPADIIELMNHPKVRAQMPLTKDNFDENDCREFVTKKEKLWDDFGFGPFAFYKENQFVGWGGVQPEAGEADLAMVLHPKYWGIGKSILRKVLENAFDAMRMESVVIFFPPTRTKIKGVLKIGFKREGEVALYGERFILFRLRSADAEKALAKL